MQVRSPRVPSGQASSRTVRRRSSELRHQRKRISGGDECTVHPVKSRIGFVVINKTAPNCYSG